MYRCFCTALIVIFLMTRNTAQSEESKCASEKLSEGQIFELRVYKFGYSNFQFRFCVNDDKGYLISDYSASKLKAHSTLNSEQDYQSNVTLTQEMTKQMLAAFYLAEASNFSNELKGGDGSTWCLRTKDGLSTRERCVWFPEFDSESRELNGLVTLGNLVFDTSQLKSVGPYF